MGIKRDVEQFALRFRERAPRLVANAVDFESHGEWSAAFEDFLSDLHDLDVPVGADEVEVAETIARRIGLSAMRVACLRGQLVEDDGRRLAVVFTVEYCNTPAVLHAVLQDALDISPAYERTWDAFRAALAASEDGAHRIEIWGWNTLAERLPREALSLLDVLLEAKREDPRTASAIELFSSDDVPLDTGEEHRTLHAKLHATPPWAIEPVDSQRIRIRD
jgi:hypothetical protein